MDELQETVQKTNLPGVFTIKRQVFADERGFFQEVVRLPDLEQAVGQSINIKQINKSVNKPKVLRGLHIAPWAKLIHCYFGNIFQVVVDCRKNSPTFGEVFTVEMGEKNPISVWVPSDCANGFCVMGESSAVYSYSVTAIFEPGKEIEITWNDFDLAPKINWPIADPFVSDRDKKGKTFREYSASL